MRWQGRRQSDNVEDRRGMPAGRLAVGGGLGTIVLLVVVMLLGGDPQALLQQMQGPPGNPAAGPQQVDPAEQPLRDFVSVVLADTEDVWRELFQKQVGRDYRDPKLVLYTGQVQSACGFASAAMGPFYCPGDEKVYLDLGFCEELQTKYRAPGDFAVAYVLAHEVGHHVQNLIGYSDRVDEQRGRVSKAKQNELSVRLELQAERPSRTNCRFAWNCRPITWPVSGLTMPNGRKRSWSRATCKKPWTPPARWATTGCRNRLKATSSRIRSLTERPPSVHGGSAWACRPAIWREPRNCSSCRRTSCNQGDFMPSTTACRSAIPLSSLSATAA